MGARARGSRSTRDDEACRKLLKAFLPPDDRPARDALLHHLERAAAARGAPLWDAARESLAAKVGPARARRQASLDSDAPLGSARTRTRSLHRAAR